MEQWAEVRRMKCVEGFSAREISRRTGWRGSSCLRDEPLNVEEFGSITGGKLIEDWRQVHNSYQPRSTLGGLTPTEYVTSPIQDTNNPEHA